MLNANNEIAMQKLTIVQSDGDSVVAVDIPSGTRVVGTRIGLPVPGMKVTTSENLTTTTTLAEGEAQ